MGGARWTGWTGQVDVSVGGVASVRRGLRAERRQRGGKHQNFGLHEGKIRQTCYDFGRLLAQILLFPRLPVKQEETPGVTGLTTHLFNFKVSNSLNWKQLAGFSSSALLIFRQKTKRHMTLDTHLLPVAFYSVCLTPDLVEVLVFSMVDIRRAKASATRLPEPPGSSLAVVSSYSSGSTPEPETKTRVTQAEVELTNTNTVR